MRDASDSWRWSPAAGWRRRRRTGSLASRWALFGGAIACAASLLGGCSPSVAPGSSAPPDVLLVSIDTLRADHVGAYGYARPTTPVIDALSAEGVRFEIAYAPMGATSPSHATLMTALLPPAHGVVRNGLVLADDALTLAERFSAAGYCTAAFVSSYPVRSTFGFAQGFTHFDEAFEARTSTVTFRGWEGQPVKGGFDRRAAETTDAAIEWLATRDEACPIFVWVHYFDPHMPHVAPEAWRRFDDEADTPRARLVAGYDAEILYTDAQLGRLLEAMAVMTASRDRITVVTADHGEGLRDHGNVTHNKYVYDSEVRIPLVFHAPGRIASGRRSLQPAHLVDVATTLAGLVGLDARGLEGVDLSAWLAEAAPEPDVSRPLFLQRPHYADAAPDDPRAEARFGVRSGPWKWIAGGISGPDELYDLVADPGELDDRAAVSPERVARLAEQGAQIASDAARQKLAPAPPRVDEADRRALEALGYVE